MNNGWFMNVSIFVCVWGSSFVFFESGPTKPDLRLSGVAGF